MFTPHYFVHMIFNIICIDSHCPLLFPIISDGIIPPKNEWTRYHPALLIIVFSIVLYGPMACQINFLYCIRIRCWALHPNVRHVRKYLPGKHGKI